MERVKKMGGLKKWKTLALFVLAVGFCLSFVPMATSAPVQDDAAGSWEDSFSDDTGIDWEYSSDNLIVSGGKVTMGATAESPDGKGWCIERVDDACTWCGDYATSLALDSNDYPHIAYINSGSADIGYARWNGSSWQIQSVPNPTGRHVGYPSLALDSNDRPHIAFNYHYYDRSRNEYSGLIYTKWDGTKWRGEISAVGPDTLEAEVNQGEFTFASISLDSNNYPRISYRNAGNLKYIKWNGASWRGEVNTGGPDVITSCDNSETSIKIDSLDRSHIGYKGTGVGYAYWNGVSWQVNNTGAWRGAWLSLALDSSENPYCCYCDEVTHTCRISCGPSYFYGGARFFGWPDFPPSGDDNDFCFSLAFDSSDNPGVSYFRGGTRAPRLSDEGVLKYSKFTGGWSWDAEVVDAIGTWHPWVGYSTSLAFDSNDAPFISYYAPGELRLAHRGYCGTLVSEEINPASLDNWDQFFANDSTPGGTNVTYSVLDGEDVRHILWPSPGYRDVVDGSDISGASATSYPTVRLMATFRADGLAPVPELKDWKVTWDVPPDVIPPTIDYLEAEDENGVLISDGPDGIFGTDDDGITISSLTDSVTITSLASDPAPASGILNHKVHFTKDDWATTSTKDCGANSTCSIDICSEATNNPAYACPLPAGTEIKYQSEATDNALNPTTYSPEKSFTVIDISVTLSADPNSGSAPLNNVDLTATVGGTATGDITYVFDCDTSVAGTDHTYTGASNPYTAVNICNYAAAGNYTASVEVTRQGITANNTTTITVNPPNNLPVMTSVTISPDSASAYTNTILTANHIPDVGDVDADGDPITFSYQWIKNDIPIGGQTNKTLPINNFVKGDKIKVTVTPNDGIGNGTPMTSPEREILNSAPTQPTVSITPGSPVETDDLTCNISVASTDADGDGINYTYEWFKDGASQGGGTTILSGSTSIGETWECEATPNDGTIDGTTSEKALVVISDSSICYAYAYNGTNDLYCSDCTIGLENISRDNEDCPDPWYPTCGGESGFSECTWDIGGSPFSGCDGTIVSSYNFGGEGTYIDAVGLTVTDQGGLSDSAVKKTLVFKKDVYADFECSLDDITWELCADIEPKIDEDTVYFRAVDGSNLSTPSNSATLTGYDWDFGDGVGASVVNPTSYIYTAENPYTVILTITDSAGRSAMVNRPITVGAAAVKLPDWNEISPE